MHVAHLHTSNYDHNSNLLDMDYQIGGTKDIINPQTGILVSKKDICQLCNAINFMISNKKQRHKYQENITQFIKSNFDWDKIIRKWKKILR